MRIEPPWGRIRFLERKNKVLEENYHLLSKLYEENERLYHDMNHHLQMLCYLAQKAENTEITDYIASISTPISQLSDVIWSGVDIVDAILNHTIAKARQMGIRIDVNAEFPQNSSIASDDLCIILFNLLDNAMEACRPYLIVQDQKPLISVTIRRIHQFLLIKVKNPCSQKPSGLASLFSTTKKNPCHHGIGLRNVRETAEKYNGNVEFEVNEDSFTASVLLFFQQESPVNQ